MLRTKETICPYISEGCKASFKSNKKLNIHLAIYHDRFKNGEQIPEAIINSIEKTQDRTMFLLVRFANCRIPHEEGYLFNRYIQYWCGTLVWDVAQQGFTSRDNKAIPYKQMAFTLKQLNSVSRARRHLQRKERLKKEAGEPYIDILPPEYAEAIALTSEKTHHSYYGNADKGIGNTYIADNEGLK